jgi:predicted SnoaL-like aldol condensation-catalyzing enzyme
MTHKQQVVALLKSIETGDSGPVGVINPDKYIQHNLGAADGLAGFGALLQALPPRSARANTVRVFEDGDYVFAHTNYNFFGPKIGFDIFRFENGRIVEHWDNLQETTGRNPNGHTMTDGPTEVRKSCIFSRIFAILFACTPLRESRLGKR